jgi:hypothetical protein
MTPVLPTRVRALGPPRGPMAEAGGCPATLRGCAGPPPRAPRAPRAPRPPAPRRGRNRTAAVACAPSPTFPGPVRPGPRARSGPPVRSVLHPAVPLPAAGPAPPVHGPARVALRERRATGVRRGPATAPSNRGGVTGVPDETAVPTVRSAPPTAAAVVALVVGLAEAVDSTALAPAPRVQVALAAAVGVVTVTARSAA